MNPITAALASRRFRRAGRPCRARSITAVCWWPSWSRAPSPTCPARSSRTGARRNKPAASVARMKRSEIRATASELQVRKRPDANAWHQHLILVVGHRIADVLVQQIVADETDHHFARAEPRGVELGLVADLRLQQVIARGRRLADNGDVVL